MTDLFEMVLATAESEDSKYRDICQCRDDLLGFLDRNEWFGVGNIWKDGRCFVEDYPEVESKIALWLRAYQRSPEESRDRLMQRLAGLFPEQKEAALIKFLR